MSQAFVVEVTAKPEVTPETSVAGLAKAFNLSSRKIELMLRRLPGVATKPITQQEAAVVVTYFEQAGLKAVVKSITVPSKDGASTPTASPPTADTATKTVAEGSSTETVSAGTTSAETRSGEASNSELSSSSEIAKARLESEKAKDTKAEGTKGDETTATRSPQDRSEASNAELLDTKTVATKALAAASEQVLDVAATQTVVPASPATDVPLNLSDLFRKPAPPASRASYTSTSTAAVITPPSIKSAPSEARPEHDILRTTLIGEPDLRQTQGAADASAAIRAGRPSLPRANLSNRLLLTAILPTLLTLLGALAITYLTVQPALYEQLRNSARHPAALLAASLSSVLTTTPTGELDYVRLQSSIEATRSAFDDQDINFMVVTDNAGNFLPASWFESSSFMTSADVRDSIKAQASGATLGNALVGNETAPSFVPLGSQGTTGGASQQGASQLEVVAEPLHYAGQTVGAVVVGVTSRTLQTNIRRILGSIALFSLIPLALASLIAILATRPITRRVTYLTQRANDISRGHLSESVEPEGNDELSELGEALERLRVSMQGALERLRRRR